ncbi:hypothetical protein Tco_1175465, partial [Tanacetum coccineum]
SIRSDLQLDDAEGMDCLPNATIFKELTRMGYEKISQRLTFYKAFFSPQWKFLIHTILQCLSAKTTAWNEFSSTMASAIICLAINQKFNFSKYIFDNMVRNVDSMGTFLMYLRFVQVFLEKQVGDMSNHKWIYVTPSHTMKIFRNMKREGKGFFGRVKPLFLTMMKKQKSKKPRRKDTEVPQPSDPTTIIADEVVNEENVSPHSNDLLLSGEDIIQLKEFMDFCTKLQQRVLDLENTKTSQAQKTTSLKKRVKKLKRRKKSRNHRIKKVYKVGLSTRIDSSDDEASLGDQEDASKQGRKIHDIDVDEDITLDSTHFDTDPDMFRVHDFDGDEVFVETEEPAVNAATTTSTTPVSVGKDLSDVDMTLAQALAKLKNAKPKAVTIVATETTTAVTRPKAKGLVIQEQEQASTPITSLKDKGKGNMVEEPLKMKKKDQDKVETDYELAQRLQQEEQEELTIKEKSKLFQQLLEKRRKLFAAKRAEENRNIPPTKAQQRSIMCTYLKNLAGWKPKDLKTNEVRVEGSKTIAQESCLKRAGDELEQEKAKKQKIDDDQEEAKIKKLMEIVPDEEEVAIDAIPLANKPPSIIDWKIVKEGKMSFFQIIRANGSSRRYSSFIQMLRDFDREDLETL